MVRALATAALAALAVAPAAAAQEQAGGRNEAWPEGFLGRALLEPRAHFFAETVEARIEVVVDAKAIDAATVRPDPRFFPYEPVGPATMTRTRRGDAVRIVYRVPITCATPACARAIGNERGARGRAAEVRLPPAAVVLRVARSRWTRTVRVPWRTSFLASRLSGPQLARLPGGEAFVPFQPYSAVFRADVAPPRATFRVTPLVAASAFLGLGALALAGAALVLAPLVPRRKPAFLEAPPKTPLEQALDVVAAVSANGAGGAEHREALERLARELRAAGLARLTPRATRLAWSPAPPTRGDSERLVADVRRALEERS